MKFNMQLKAMYLLKIMCLHFSFTFYLHYWWFPSSLYTFFCRYEQSELIERELEQMTEQIKSIIHSLNSNQGGEVEAPDGMTPLDAVVRILNNQLTSLMWIDEKVCICQSDIAACCKYLQNLVFYLLFLKNFLRFIFFTIYISFLCNSLVKGLLSSVLIPQTCYFFFKWSASDIDQSTSGWRIFFPHSEAIKPRFCFRSSADGTWKLDVVIFPEILDELL